MVFGVDDAAYLYAGATAAAAASGAYSANQASQTSSGNAQMANMTNMVMQAQNQDFNSAEAARTRDFNSYEASMARDFQANQQSKAMDFNDYQGNKNREFQEQMSNTAYQRATADMKAAGINPMLAVMKGGADTPNGSAASIQAGGAAQASGGQASSGGWAGATKPDIFQAGAAAANSARDVIALKASVDNMNADTKLKQAQVPKVEREALSIEAQTKNIEQTLDLLKEQTRTEGYRGNKTQYESYTEVQREDLTRAQKQLTDVQKQVARKEIDNVEASTRLKNIQARLDELAESGAKAEDAINRSGYGSARPLLKDAASAAGTASGISKIMGR